MSAYNLLVDHRTDIRWLVPLRVGLTPPLNCSQVLTVAANDKRSVETIDPYHKQGAKRFVKRYDPAAIRTQNLR